LSTFYSLLSTFCEAAKRRVTFPSMADPNDITPASQSPSVVEPQGANGTSLTHAVDRSLIDRSALERVLGRAAELQSAAGDDGEPADGLSEQQLLDIGREVGLSPMHLRQALAEERTRIAVPPEHGFVAQMAGASMASAHRTVMGTPTQLLATLNQVMLRDECLTVKRRYLNRLTWEPRRDFWATFRRLAPSAGRMYDLLRANEVAATAVPVDDTRTLVRLDADVSNARAQRLQGGAAVAVGGIATGGLITAFFTAIAMAPLAPALLVGAVPAALGVAAFAAVVRTHRQTVERAQLALEQVLDRLEHGEARRPASFFDVLTGYPRLT
jgi:hypothetical protein